MWTKKGETYIALKVLLADKLSSLKYMYNVCLSDNIILMYRRTIISRLVSQHRRMKS